MPRKVTGEKLEKVISTKISAKKFELFEKYAREYYIRKKITQPTISALLRGLINSWLPKLESQNVENNTQTNAPSATSSKPVEPVHDFSRMRQTISKMRANK